MVKVVPPACSHTIIEKLLFAGNKVTNILPWTLKPCVFLWVYSVWWKVLLVRYQLLYKFSLGQFRMYTVKCTCYAAGVGKYRRLVGIWFGAKKIICSLRWPGDILIWEVKYNYCMDWVECPVNVTGCCTGVLLVIMDKCLMNFDNEFHSITYMYENFLFRYLWTSANFNNQGWIT